MNNFNIKETKILLENCLAGDTQVKASSIDACLKRGGYKTLNKIFNVKPVEIISEVEKSGLIGRGGACFPTGTKWRMASNENATEKYIVCNADEGEPGTFKDKVLLDQDPHKIIEGIIIAAYAIGATEGYIYIKGEYFDSIEIMKNAIKEAKTKGFLGTNIMDSNFSFNLKVFSGMGAYVCGEETALIESIEGRRGIPRIKPPYPTSEGLNKKPTVINNVETISNIPHIILNGSDWYRGLGVKGSFGTKLFSISGNVKKPGVYEIELGKYSLEDLIYGLCNGIEEDRDLKAIIPGGASTCFLDKKSLKVKMDYSSLKNIGTSLGTGAIIVFDDSACIPAIVEHFFDFYCDESCGYCFPCRLGTKAIKDILRLMLKPITSNQTDILSYDYPPQEQFSIEQLTEIGEMLRKSSRCGLGQSAANPLLSSIRLFKEEYEDLIKKRQHEYVMLT